MAYGFSKQAANSAGGGGQSSIVATFGSNIAAASCLPAVVYYVNATSVSINLTGAPGGTWVQVGSEIGNGTDGWMELWVCLNATGGGTQITGNFGSSIIFPGIYVGEFTGLDTASALTGHAELRQVNPNAGATPATADAVSTGNMTPPGQPALVFGFSLQVAGTGAPAAGTGYTGLTAVWDFGGATAICCRPEHRRITGTSQLPASFTAPDGDTSNYLNVGVVVLEPGGGGGGGDTSGVMTVTRSGRRPRGFAPGIAR